jgi:rare lipoprotein A
MPAIDADDDRLTAPLLVDAPGARPRVDPVPRGAPNLPYWIGDERYVPTAEDVPIRQTGIASWYGEPFHGRLTASGEVYDMRAMTAAHPTMPLPSYALVRHLASGREVIVRVNDRGPFVGGRVIDLSLAAARRLGIDGIGRVEVIRLTHDDIRHGRWLNPAVRLASADLAPSR